MALSQIKYSPASPKLGDSDVRPRDRLYPYYAGFSRDFVRDTIGLLQDLGCQSVFDPWNGTGTLTLVAASTTIQSTGSDLNPVMVLAAKAKLVSATRVKKLTRYAVRIVKHARIKDTEQLSESDPLCQWLDRNTAWRFRAVAKALSYPDLDNWSQPDLITEKQVVLGLILFRVLRQVISPFLTSNPTWIRKAGSKIDRVSLSGGVIAQIIKSVSRSIASLLREETIAHESTPKIILADSTDLGLDTASYDACVTSPPYCTRIDYAVATLPELSVLCDSMESLTRIRRQMIGSTLAPSEVPTPQLQWGRACNRFLSGVLSHSSKASRTYYYRGFVDYFSKLSKSLGEIARVLREDGTAIMVLRGSHYKDIVVDLPVIITDMAAPLRLELVRSIPFVSGNNFASVHKHWSAYKRNSHMPEVVLWFRKA